MKIPSFETALSRMKMITVPEWERYANHSCADYVAQGKTFTYNKLDRLKDMNFNHLDKEIPNSQSSAQASVETDTNSDNVVQGNDSDDFVDFVNNSDAAAMNGEGEDGSLLDQSIQEESPTLSSGGTQTEKASNLATFGTQTNKNTNMISGEAQTDIQTPIRSIQTDTRGLMSNASVDTGSRNPMRSIETQTRGLMSDASAQTGSRNPMKSIEPQTIGAMTDASIQASSEGYNCPTCGKRLSTKYALNRHRREVHKEIVETPAQKKIKKMQMLNQNCKTPPPPPLTKGPSNLLKPHRPTKTMKAVLKIKKLSLLKMVDEIKKLQIPLKEKSKILKSLKLSFKQCKNCEFITEDTCILEEHELINHQRVEVSIHIQSNSPQAESESEAIVPLNIETSPCEEVGNTQQLSNRPSSSYPLTLSIFHKSMRCKKGIELDKKKMKMKINKMRNFLKFNIDEDVSQPNVHQIIPPASNNFSVDLHLKWIQNKLRKNREYNASQKESEKEVIIPLNIETPPEGMDNTQQLSTRSLSPVDEVVIQSNAPQTEPEKEDIIPSNIETLLPEVDNTQQFSTRPSSTVDSKYSFFFHKSLRKQGTKRKFNLDEDDNEENVERPRKMMRMGMKIIWNKYRIHWGRLGHHRSQRRA